ncbi:hypothetical protein BC834DRAFT_181364 [Gloeopeniophorella convolvens]|nr:hypothetical protein BC834DRAFT_181364 [Gloeopeniophorella convolvens]
MPHFPRIWHRPSPASLSSFFNQSLNQTTPLTRTWSLRRASPHIYPPSRSTSTSSLPSPSLPSPRLGRTPRKQISTLDPDRLQPSDFVNFSTHSMVGVWTTPPGLYEAPRVRLRYAQRASNVRIPFPPGTHGFLYYARDPGLAEGGQIRFRIVATPEGAFEEGQDLSLPNGMPWHVTPGILPRAPTVGLVRLLLRDELVTREQVAAWES